MASEGVIDFADTADYFFDGLIYFTSAIWQPAFAATAVTIVQLAFLYLL